MQFSLIRNLTLAISICAPFALTNAADRTWSGTVNSTWDTTTANWTGATFSNYDNAIFNSTGAGAVTIASGVNTGGVKINASGYSFSGGPLTFATGVSGTGGDVKVFAAGGTTTTVSSYFTYTNSNSLYLGATDFSSNWDGTINFTGGGDAGGISGDHGNRDIFAGFFNNSTVGFQAGSYYANGFFAFSNVNIGAATINTGYFRTSGNGNLVHLTDSSSTLNVNYNFGIDSIIVGSNNNTSTLQLTQGTINSAGGIIVMNVNDTNTSTENVGTLLVEGGTLNVAGNVGITLVRGENTNSHGSAVFTVTGGTVNTPAISFGGGNVAGQGNSATFNLQGGSVYVGSGGIVKSASAAPVNTANLSGGTLGASADWTSSFDFNLSNTNGGVTIKTAGVDDTAHNIGLSGILSGSGSLTKSGTGVLTISGANTYAGGTSVTAGTLVVASGGNLGLGNVTVGANSTLTLQTFTSINDLANVSFTSSSFVNLDFTGTEVIASLWNATTNQFAAPNTYTSADLNLLFGGSSFAGTGSLTITAVPEPSSVGLIIAGLMFTAVMVRRRQKATI